MDGSLLSGSVTHFKRVTLENSLKAADSYHAAHCCIYSPNMFSIFEEYESKAFILMQMRFDGHLGFPGGEIDEGTDIVAGLNRELQEEINLDSSFFVTDEDYLFSHEYVNSKQFFHFYAKKVSAEDFASIEREVIKALDYGHENMGNLRVPLFTMKDGFRGFPAFLSNRFAGNAKHQLLNFLLHSNLMSNVEIQEAEEKSEHI